MEALIDTNVLITFLTDRDDPYLKSSYKIVKFCCNGKIKGSMAFHSLSTIWYVLRKQDRKRVREVLWELVNIISVVGADQKRIREAIEMDDFKDFEDCGANEKRSSIECCNGHIVGEKRCNTGTRVASLSYAPPNML